jgi:intein/homing endonuclease
LQIEFEWVFLLNQKMALKKEQLMLEYIKCMKDTVYTLKTYLQTYDNTVSKYVPLELFPDQIALLEDYEKYNENIALKYRQAGVSTVTAAWLSKKLVFANKQKPEKVLIIANKQDTSLEVANKIRAFITQYPAWMGVNFSQEKNSQKHYKLTNGCEVKAVATSKDALRGFTPTILIFDEAAFIDADSDFWAACMASLSCVHEDSYIFTDNGLMQLKDIIDEKNKIGFTEYTGDIKVINKDGEITEIKNTFKSVRSVCYNIKTKSGYELTGSYKHPLLVNTGGDNEEWVWMENLKMGDNIKMQFNQNLFGADQEIDFKLKHYNEKEKYKLPLRLSDDLDLCYLMGLFIAEGNYSENTIAITNGDDEIIEFLMSKGFSKSREHHYYYSSSYLTRFFQEYIGINKTKANGKKIPSIILRSSREVVKAFLQGMFDGDGCAFKNGVKYTTTSKELASQLQILLLNFGVQSYIKYTEEKTSETSVLTNKNHITKIYNLYIKNQYIHKFFDEIGFRLTRKQNKKNDYINKLKNRQFIYATKDELKLIFKENNIRRSQYEKEFRFMDGLLRINRSRISLHSIEKLFDKNLYNKNTLSIWENRYENLKNYFYDEIVEIVTFEDDTYDLEILNGHSFISNGIISHNTGGKVVVVSTPNGYDPIYYEIYDQSLRGMNDFKITEMYWYRDPRYTKDLYMVKTTDIIHYLLNKEDYKKTDIISWGDIPFEKRDFNELSEIINKGYKPCSSWFEGMVKKLKYDKRKVSQELECVVGETIITIRDKATGLIKKIEISELYELLREN